MRVAQRMLLLSIVLLAASGCTEAVDQEPLGITLTGKADSVTDHGVFRATYSGTDGYVRLEVLDDDLVRVEFGAGPTPNPAQAIPGSPMVQTAHYRGPREIHHQQNTITTAALIVTVRDNGCVRFADRARRDELLTTGCPAFTLYEDDGVNVYRYDAQGRPLYQTRSTVIRQAATADSVEVVIETAEGSYRGGATARQNELRVVTEGRPARQVTVNGVALPQIASPAAFEGCGSGWFNAESNTILVRTGKRAVSEHQSVVIALR